MKKSEKGKQWLNIREVMNDYGIEEIDFKVRKIEEYVIMMAEKREWAGLTSRNMIKRIEDAVVQSIMVVGAARCEEKDVVEIGGGGGVLGVVVSIVCPKWAVTMTERSSRKSAFLAEVVGKIGIENAGVFHGDARLLAGKKEFDLCLSRASGRLVDLAPIALDLLRTGGRYIALKQKDVECEVDEAMMAIKAGGGALEEAGGVKMETEGPQGGVSLVVIGKS